MKRTILAFLVSLLMAVSTVCGCEKLTTTTQTEIQTVPGPTTTQTANVTGPVTITTQTQTMPGLLTTTTKTIISTIVTSVTGPTTTVVQTQTVIPTQGFNYISSIKPASPATLHFSDLVTISFEYVITDPGGAIMWAVPMTNGQQTPNCSFSTSATVPAGRGTVSRTFSVGSGSVKVNEIHLLMRNPTDTVTFFETYIPVDYTYGP